MTKTTMTSKRDMTARLYFDRRYLEDTPEWNYRIGKGTGLSYYPGLSYRRVVKKMIQYNKRNNYSGTTRTSSVTV